MAEADAGTGAGDIDIRASTSAALVNKGIVGVKVLPEMIEDF